MRRRVPPDVRWAIAWLTLAALEVWLSTRLTFDVEELATMLLSSTAAGL